MSPRDWPTLHLAHPQRPMLATARQRPVRRRTLATATRSKTLTHPTSYSISLANCTTLNVKALDRAARVSLRLQSGWTSDWAAHPSQRNRGMTSRCGKTATSSRRFAPSSKIRHAGTLCRNPSQSPLLQIRSWIAHLPPRSRRSRSASRHSPPPGASLPAPRVCWASRVRPARSSMPSAPSRRRSSTTPCPRTTQPRASL